MTAADRLRESVNALPEQNRCGVRELPAVHGRLKAPAEVVEHPSRLDPLTLSTKARPGMSMPGNSGRAKALLIDDPSGAIRARFMSKVDKTGDCWQWLGTFDRDGYGEFKLTRATHRPAHRVSYALAHGEAAAAMTIDHLCRNRSCVNPAHLEQVDNATNVLRGEGITARNARALACSKGHPWTEENTGYRSSGRRTCRRCAADKASQYGLERRERESLGRRPRLVGKAGPTLTEPEVIEIIRRNAEGETYPALALEFGVGSLAIARICRGERWKHIPRPLKERA